MATKMRHKKLITLPRKMERREKNRESKALIAAKLENKIEMEILERVKQGVYGERYKFKDNVFEKALAGEMEEETEEAGPSTSRGKKRAKEVEVPVKLSKKYVPDIEDLAEDEFSDNDNYNDDFWASEDEEWEREQEVNQKEKKRKMLTVEYE